MKLWWRPVEPSDVSDFPGGWHLIQRIGSGDPEVVGSVCGEYVPTESSYGERVVGWRWRTTAGRRGNMLYASDADAKDALEQYWRRLAAAAAQQVAP